MGELSGKRHRAAKSSDYTRETHPRHPKAMTVESAKTDTFPKLLLQHARERGHGPAIRQKDLGIWQTWTGGERREEV